MKNKHQDKLIESARSIFDRSKAIVSAKNLSIAEEAGKQTMAFLKTNPLKSVGMKLFVTFFASILLFVIVMGVTSYFLSKDVIEEKVSDASRQTIIQASEKLDILFNSFEEMTMQVVADSQLATLLQRFYAAENGTFEQIDTRKQIETKMFAYATNKAFQSLSLIDESGKMIYSNSNVSAEAGQKDWFKKIVEGDGRPVWLSGTQEGFMDAKSAGTFALGRLIKNMGGGSKPTVLFIEFRLEVIGDSLQSIQMGQSGSKFIVNNDNKFVYHDQVEKISTDSVIQVGEDVASDENLVLKDENDKDQLVVFHKSKVTEWTIVGTVPMTELLAASATIRNMTWLMAVIAVIVALIIGYFVVRMIGRPLVELSGLMKEGERGNLAVRVKVRGQDEIGQLGLSFNEMMEKITVLVQQTTHSAKEVLNTSSELSEASRKTALAAKEIAVATEEIAGGASSLAMEAERGNEITQKIGEQMKEVVEANTEMSEAASVVLKASDQGTQYMAELIGKTNATEEMTRSMTEKVDKLKESTRSIRKILDLLNNITKQTNILSLNATIEAARAGAAGKGFMVVADEIRKLADQSRQSIDVVGQITETIQSEIDETVSVLSEAYPIFQEQIVSVKEADTIFRQVRDQMGGFTEKLEEATGSIRQLDASQVVLTEAMSNVSAVAEESSATSQEVASLSNEQTNVSDGLVRLSEKLESLSTLLQDSLSKFKV